MPHGSASTVHSLAGAPGINGLSWKAINAINVGDITDIILQDEHWRSQALWTWLENVLEKITEWETVEG